MFCPYGILQPMFITPQKILIIQTAFPGDVVLTLPLVQVLHKNFPTSQIDFLTIPKAAELLQNHPAIHSTIIYDKRKTQKGVGQIFHLAKKLRQQKYALAIIPHRSLRSAVIAFLSKIPMRIGFSTSAGKIFFTHKILYRKDYHEIERNLSLLEPFRFNISTKEFPNLYPSLQDEKIVKDFLVEKNLNSFVAIAPGSVWKTKRWLKEKFSELAKELVHLNISVVLIGGKEDEQLCEEIRNTVNNEKIYNVAGKFTLLQSAEILRKSRVLISNDSAPQHLAVAMRTPIIAIFGATVPEFGFYPYGEKDIIIEKKNLSCRPCGIHGGNICPEKHFDCMKTIEVDEVFNAVKKFL